MLPELSFFRPLVKGNEALGTRLVRRRFNVHFQGSEEGALLHAMQELRGRLLLLTATGKVLSDKGLDGLSCLACFLTILLTFCDRHHRQFGQTLQVLALVLCSLSSLPHVFQELHGLGRVGICFGAAELGGGQPTLMAVPVTTVKLVDGLSVGVVAIHGQLPGSKAFLPVVELRAKVCEVMTDPGQPFVGCPPRLLGFQALSTGRPGGEQSHRHGLTQGPRVQGISVVAHHFLHRAGGLAVLAVADLGQAFLSVTVEDDGGAAYHVLLEELVEVVGVKTGEV